MSSPRTLFRRRGDTMSSTTSSYSGDSDEDAITPCPPHSQPNASLEQLERREQTEQQPTHRRPSVHGPRRQRPTSWRSTLSYEAGEPDTTTITDAEAVDPETLWRRMLALQRRFGCYNSARMRAALDQDVDAVPSRTCLDLLNDSIDTLPEEERKQLEAFLGSGKGSGKRRSWRERLHGTAAGRAGEA